MRADVVVTLYLARQESLRLAQVSALQISREQLKNPNLPTSLHHSHSPEQASALIDNAFATARHFGMSEE